MLSAIVDLVYYVVIGVATIAVVRRLYTRVRTGIATNISIVYDVLTIAIGIILLAGKYTDHY